MTAKTVPVVAKTVDLSEFRRTRKPGCTFANVDLKPDDVDKLKGAMQADDISAAAIWEWMKDRGYSISERSITKHRTGRCSCQ